MFHLVFQQLKLLKLWAVKQKNQIVPLQFEFSSHLSVVFGNENFGFVFVVSQLDGLREDQKN